MSSEPKKVDRRKFIYAGLGAVALIAIGAAAYVAMNPPVVTQTVTTSTTVPTTSVVTTTVPTTSVVTTTVPTTSTVTSTATIKKPVIVLWWTSELDEAWRKQFSEYEQRTGQAVVYEAVGWADMHAKKLATWAAQSDRFDVSFSYPPEYPSDHIYFEPLDQYVSPEEKHLIVDPAIEINTIDGQLKVLPFFATLRVLHYRKDLFDQAGISRPPKNWDEMIEYGKEIQDMTKGSVWGTLWAWKGDAGLRYFNILLNTVDGKLYDEKFKPAFNTPEGLRVMEFINDVMNTHKICPPGALTWANTGAEMPNYYQGNAAMVIEDVSLLKTANMTLPFPSKANISIVPGTEIKASGSCYLPQGFIINKFSTNKDAAVKLIKYFALNNDAVVNMYKLCGYIPVLRSALQDPRITDNPLDKAMFDTTLAQLQYNCEPWTRHPKYSIFRDVITDEIAAMLLGQKTPKQALQDAESKILSQL